MGFRNSVLLMDILKLPVYDIALLFEDLSEFQLVIV